ncbi:MAG: RtcB family protein [Cytophagaceae bacterium]
MGNLKIKVKDLKRINYNSDKSRSLAVTILAKNFKHLSAAEQIDLLVNVKSKPMDFIHDEVLGMLAAEFAEKPVALKKSEIPLRSNKAEMNIFGRRHIMSNAYQQMQTAMSLPVVERGALMPDAHMGYGIPIGGVLATKDTVIPYAVGVDIGCRMNLSIYEVDPGFLIRNSHLLKTSLKERTFFGGGATNPMKNDHEILDRKEFCQTDLLRRYHDKAVKQLGTSGSGNHFVEFGIVSLQEEFRGLAKGEYLGLLSHSGSRGLGAAIASFYTDVAIKKCLLPRQVRSMAWLSLDSSEGQEYWLSMNLAGDYAKACHDIIHLNLSKYIGLKPVLTFGNHHNFAWKETQENGEEWIVHRKGATPAQENVPGIIPGSMTAKGYIVKGKGNPSSLCSASHGAGRRMSRADIRESVSGSSMKKMLAAAGVSLIGGDTDEAPVAYKDLEEVMKSQAELVEIIGSFLPKIVRMDGKV